MKIKFLLALSLILFIPLNAYSKILQLNNCDLTEPAERDAMRDRVIKIDLKNKKLTFRGYAAYTNPVQIKDELLVYQNEIIFTVFDNKLVKMELNPNSEDLSKSKHEYTADFERNIFQIKSWWYLNSGTETDLVIYTCENSNFEKAIMSNKEKSGSKSKSLLKKLLKKN